MVENPNQSQPIPGLRADGTPCKLPFTFCVSNASGADGSATCGPPCGPDLVGPPCCVEAGGGGGGGMGMAAVADLWAGLGEEDELPPPPPPRTMLPSETPRERRPAAPPNRFSLTLSAAAARGLRSGKKLDLIRARLIHDSLNHDVVQIHKFLMNREFAK